LTDWLDGIGEILVELVQHSEQMPEYLMLYIPTAVPDDWRVPTLQAALELATECLAISEEFRKPDTRFRATLQIARIAALQGNTQEAITRLVDELQNETDLHQRAELHYWICKLSPANAPGVDRDMHKREALKLYTQLLDESQRVDYQQRIDGLNEWS
jgi:hypothetical protein